MRAIASRNAREGLPPATAGTTPAMSSGDCAWSTNRRLFEDVLEGKAQRPGAAEFQRLDDRQLRDLGIGIELADITLSLRSAGGSRGWRRRHAPELSTAWAATPAPRLVWTIAALAIFVIVGGAAALSTASSTARPDEIRPRAAIDPTEMMRRAPRYLPIEQAIAH